MSNQRPDPFFEKLESVVYGCHAESRDQVRQVFEQAELYTFTFAEYFLDEPVAMKTDVAGLEAMLNRRKMYFPFLPWAASLLLFRVKTATPDTPNERIPVQFLAKTGKWKRELREECGSGTELSKWESQSKRILTFCGDVSSWAYDEVIDQSVKIAAARQRAVELQKGNHVLNEGMVSYDIQLHLWSESDVTSEKPVIIVRVPIATDHCYYGHLLVVYQEQHSVRLSDGGKKVERYEAESTSVPICVTLRTVLENLVKDRYAPTLALLHVSEWEKDLYEKTSPPKGQPKEMPEAVKNGLSIFPNNAEVSPLSLNWAESQHPIERAFGRLWQNRESFWNKDASSEGKKKACDTINKSIVLHKYHIASPAMIKQVNEVVRGASLMKAIGCKSDSLPSGLVFGEAGSGKDKMARLIGTLTEDFWAIEPTTQNMAAIKPALLAVPLMFGIKIKENVAAPGIFKKQSSNGDAPDPQILILDELNSLDYDMQGSLLRMLENNETSPMFGGGQPEPVNALVIGVVNEDPERVTHEEELRLLDGAREFLGQAEAARLYEALNRTRRLRPDLVYRLKRGIYVRMPSLRQRREDIPFLFSHPCIQTVRDLATSAGMLRVNGTELLIQCELEAYDELMRKDLPWPGNIRQLQAVASKVASIAWERHTGDKKKQNDGSVFVSRADVIVVLKDEFPDAYVTSTYPNK